MENITLALPLFVRLSSSPSGSPPWRGQPRHSRGASPVAQCLPQRTSGPPTRAGEGVRPRPTAAWSQGRRSRSRPTRELPLVGGKTTLQPSAGQAARKTDAPGCPRIANLEAPLPQIPPVRGASFTPRDGSLRGRMLTRRLPSGLRGLQHPPPSAGAHVVPGLFAEQQRGQNAWAREDGWGIGPPLDSGNIDHSRPPLGTIIE